MNTTHSNQDVDALQRQMSTVRHKLKDDVSNVVQSTKALADWKMYMRKYPFACMAAVAAAGYMLVPAKKTIISPDEKTLAKLAKRNKLVVQMDPKPQTNSRFAGSLFGMVSSLLVRGLTTYLGVQAGKIGDAMGQAQPDSRVSARVDFGNSQQRRQSNHRHR